MNKQELIDYCNAIKENKSQIINCIDVNEIIKKIEQLDEPQKVTVPQFVADWIKYAIENDWDFQDLFKCIEDEEDEELTRWVYHERNQETLAATWINGYEVEKEKRYLVKMKSLGTNFSFLNLNKTHNHWMFSSKNECDIYQVRHTRKELEEAGFGWVFDLFMFESKQYNEKEALAELLEDYSYPFEIIGNIYENPELLEVTK